MPPEDPFSSGTGVFSTDFSLDFDADQDTFQDDQSLVATGIVFRGGTLTRTQAPQTISAICVTGLSLNLNLTQVAQTLSASGNVPFVERLAALSVTAVGDQLSAQAQASTSFVTGSLTKTQDTQRLTNEAIPPPPDTGDGSTGGVNPTVPTVPLSLSQLIASGAGSLADMLARMKAVLPTGWFPTSDTPILDGILSGIAAVWSAMWLLMAYIAKQRRIATASDVNLDLIAADYLGTTLPRKAGELDDAYRARLQASIFQPAGTRSAVSRAIKALTGYDPKIFEPANPADTGGWGAHGSLINTGLGYGVAGGYGSYALPYQAFIQTNLPQTSSQSIGVQGYGTPGGFVVTAIGGYGVGAIEYTSGKSALLSASDAEIYAAVNAVKPIASIMWVSTQLVTTPTDGGTGPTEQADELDVDFILDTSRLG